VTLCRQTVRKVKPSWLKFSAENMKRCVGLFERHRKHSFIHREDLSQQHHRYQKNKQLEGIEAHM